MIAYRDATACVEAELAVVEAAQRRALAGVPAGHRSLYVRRTARIAAGMTGVAAVAILAIAMIERLGCARWIPYAWAAVGIAYAIGAWVASRALRRELGHTIVRTGEPFRDLAALRAVDVAGLERELASRRVHESYAWPLLAITLLGPSSLHVLVGHVGGWSYPDLDLWLGLTWIFSPHVLLYGALVAWRFPRTRRVWNPVLRVTALALFPGILTAEVSAVIVLVSASAIAVIGYLPMLALMRREEDQGSFDITMPCGSVLSQPS